MLKNRINNRAVRRAETAKFKHFLHLLLHRLPRLARSSFPSLQRSKPIANEYRAAGSKARNDELTKFHSDRRRQAETPAASRRHDSSTEDVQISAWLDRERRRGRREGNGGFRWRCSCFADWTQEGWYRWTQDEQIHYAGLSSASSCRFGIRRGAPREEYFWSVILAPQSSSCILTTLYDSIATTQRRRRNELSCHLDYWRWRRKGRSE